MPDYLEKLHSFEKKLLHLEDLSNRQIDLKLDDYRIPTCEDVYTLYDNLADFGKRFYNAIRNRIGKGDAVSVLLSDSSVTTSESGIQRSECFSVEWSGCVPKDDFRTPQKKLNSYIESIYKDVREKGINPLFLSIGAVKWKITRPSSFGSDAEQVITSPLIIFPIKLIRSTNFLPVGIEFVDDDIYVNECFCELFNSIYEGHLPPFPLPVGNDGDDRSIDVETFDFNAYWETIDRYVKEHIDLRKIDSTVFEFLPDLVAISEYTHEDICMFRDIRRNQAIVENHPLIKRVFGGEVVDIGKVTKAPLKFALQYDEVQKEIIQKVIGDGECVKVQGPPGTGKTQTIANIIACCMATGKKVLFVSRKKPAIDEVYRKLPENLQPFVLRLGQDSEHSVAGMKPADLQAEFRKTLDFSLAELNASAVGQKDGVLTSKENALSDKLENYHRLMFEDLFENGYTFYDALTEYLRFDCQFVKLNAEPITYLRTAKKTVFTTAYADVAKLAKWYDVFTDNCRHSPLLSPHFGIDPSCVTNRFLPDATLDELKTAVKKIKGRLSDFPTMQAVAFHDLLLVASLDDEKFVDRFADFEYILDATTLLCEIAELHGKLTAEGLFDKYRNLLEDGSLKGRTAFELPNLDETFYTYTIAELEQFTAFFEDKIVNRIRIEKTAVTESVNAWFGAKQTLSDNLQTVTEIFGENALSDVRCKKLKKHCSAVSKYAGKSDTELSKNLFSELALRSLSKLRENDTPIKPARLVAGAVAYTACVNAVESMKEQSVNLSQTIEKQLKDEDIERIATMLKLESERKIFEHLLGDIKGFCQAVKGAFAGEVSPSLLKISTDGMAEDLRHISTILPLYKSYSVLTARLNALTEIDLLRADQVVKAEDLALLQERFDAIRLARQSENPRAFIGAMQSVLKELHFVIEQVTSYADTATTYFAEQNSVYHDARRFGVAEAEIFVREVNDGKARSAMSDFQKLLLQSESNNNIVLHFFRPFLVGDRSKDAPFENIFAKCFYGNYIECVKNLPSVKAKNSQAFAKLPIGMQQLSTFSEQYANGRLQTLQDEFAGTENSLLACNVDFIALSEIARVAKLKSDYPHTFDIFNDNKSIYRNARLIFKHQAREIMMLKSCYLMSPAAVSVLLGNEAFREFDIAIFDEASQIEPQHLIPVLFRAKQCVIIGDEFQMPPIKHFVRKSADDESDEYAKIESALDLVSNGRGKFSSVRLRCHYRSNCESLIAYSQKYYPDMVTFPSKTNFNDHMGIRDILVNTPLGGGANGSNPTEAKAVISALERHFEINPDLSVGVMTFGERQVDLVVKLIRESPVLKAKYFDEKAFFVEAIGKLQGREVDHVIMSMTYAKNASGLLYGLGDLSRDYGEQVFNVASSRAKNMLTVIHSFTASEIAMANTSASGYLSEFLRIVAEHAGEEHTVLGGTAGKFDNPFVQDVVKYLTTDCQVPSERILVNYGATEKSLRIPIVITDAGRTQAEIAIFCEVPPIVGGQPVDYIDFSTRYHNSLVNLRDWDKSICIFAYDWIYNPTEKQALQKFITENIGE